MLIATHNAPPFPVNDNQQTTPYLHMRLRQGYSKFEVGVFEGRGFRGQGFSKGRVGVGVGQGRGRGFRDTQPHPLPLRKFDDMHNSHLDESFINRYYGTPITREFLNFQICKNSNFSYAYPIMVKMRPLIYLRQTAQKKQAMMDLFAQPNSEDSKGGYLVAASVIPLTSCQGLDRSILLSNIGVKFYG